MYDGAAGMGAKPAKAVQWFEKAAEQGVPEAQAALASAYLAGEGKKQDFSKAYFWLQAAASSGHAAFAKTARDVERLLKPEETAQLRHEAAAWRRDHPPLVGGAADELQLLQEPSEAPTAPR
jgi:TPR repeat protein